ncbi:histone deacetylase family protein [Xinfangfangia sp. CPCC 101601]|uniref:Histone deacetylase family protein n=1 Tax=Pseudogemmobacter lacusdianii TaxID=3069608 RepID=A0ABU0VXS3_9RHOB|nr:histone deacetylase family protein [Xinfangfangia sp. CPCC 101601]MDQ2066559.1 histone deacetylase family protein [Xinfangfangia sp. CPCC 101601]
MIVFSHSDSDGHVTPPGHPERVDRMAAVEAGLRDLSLERRVSPLGSRADVLLCHPAAYHDHIAQSAPPEGWAQIDGDTYLSPGSYAAAMRAVGGMGAAVDAVLGGEAASAFVACRPPGHHAEAARAMGFCLFGTVAIGAALALQRPEVKRVAIVDFDVHHGNGTQDLLWDEGRCLFTSSQEMPLFPGTGRADERGAHGQMINLPLRAGSDGAAMRAAYERLILPAVSEWQPDLLLVSAGFDAHHADPLASLQWEADDFRWLAQRLWEVSGGRVVSALEGGYDLPALTESVRAYVGEMARLSA